MECGPSNQACSPGKNNNYKSLHSMIHDYVLRKRPHKNEERKFFRQLPLEKTIGTAALAKNCEGKRSSHHRRRTPAQLNQGKARLLAKLPRIRTSKNFDELHNVVREMTDGVKGLGELYAYDTAYLIGARLSLWPKRVYLHAGTREGAKALGFSGRVPYLRTSQLPTELRRLRPCEIEDFLCIYRSTLRQLKLGEVAGDRRVG